MSRQRGEALRAARRGLLRLLPPALRVRVVWAAIRLRRRAVGRHRGLVDLGGAGAALVIAVGADTAELRACVEALRAEGGESVLVPVLLTDCDDFAFLRGCGVPFEYVPPRGDWERAAGQGDYDEFLRRRRSAVAEAYGATASAWWTGERAEMRAALRAR